MKLLWTAVAVSFLVSMFGCGSGEAMLEAADERTSNNQELGTAVTHFNWNGGSAAASWGDRSSWHDINAYQGKTGKQSEAYFNAFSYQADPTSEVCETVEVECGSCPVKGAPCDCAPVTDTWCHFTRNTWEYFWGPINPATLHLSSNAARIDLDLATAPGMYYSRCTSDDLAGTYVCTESPAIGRVALQFRRNGEGSATWSGASSNRWGKYVSHHNGASRTVSAAVTGTAFGLAVNTTGTIGSGTNVAIDILPVSGR
jgi:hypothetical protein